MLKKNKIKKKVSKGFKVLAYIEVYWAGCQRYAAMKGPHFG